MKLYEIDQQIQELLSQVDEATGEISEEVFVELSALNMARADKIENVGLYIKTLKAEAGAIKAEKMALAERQAAKERKLERLTDYLDYACAGQKFESPRLTVNYRRSTAVEITDESKVPEGYREPQPDKILKTEISKALKGGQDVPGAALIERQNIQIK